MLPDRTVEALAWLDEAPEPAYQALAGQLAFYASREDEAWVDDERATPQPGGYYGGWVARE